MEGEAISATIEVLVQNLITVSKDEISLMRGLEKDAEKLKVTLGTIQNSLDAAHKKFIDDDDDVKRWLTELEAVAFDADNVLDELDYKRISKEMKSIRTQKKKRASCRPSFKRYVHRRQKALTINKINTRFEAIDTRATKLGLERRLADAHAAPDSAALETDAFTIDPTFIGRDNDVLKIVVMFTTPTEEALSILPIVGMGGLWKTTLARKVFNHEKTHTYFGLRIWVHVSPNFEAVDLLKKIRNNLQAGNVDGESKEGGNVDGESQEAILNKLRGTLGSKTYLLVLDDVWNEDRKKWDDFINSWSGISSSKGSCILVTTRNTEVGSIVNTLHVHELKVLSEEECWSIIKDRAFKGGDVPRGFEALLKDVGVCL